MAAANPRQGDAIAAAELERALADPDLLHGITRLVTRWTAAFRLDPDGVTRTEILGSERMSRKLNDALPRGDQALREDLWTFLRAMLSPRLSELHRDTFVADPGEHRSTVALAARDSDSTLEDLDLDDLPTA